ncbi:hypothetical protein ACQ4LE_001555, partial [Meloidogyne hapla]
MCQSFTSVPKTYIRAADELIPLSHVNRLASLPSLSPLPFQCRHSLTTGGVGSSSHPSRFSPLETQRPPRAIPQSLTKSLPKRQGRMTIEKNLDELAPLGNEWEKSQPGTGICGKCVLCLLLNAVFVLALFLAFLIGHFASEAHLHLNNKTNNNNLNNLLLTHNNASINKINQNSFSSLLQNQTEIKQKELIEFKKNIEKSRQTIKDIYPPQLYDSENIFDFKNEEDFALTKNSNDIHHSTSKIFSRLDYSLVPLPRIVLPRHYNVDLDLTEFYGIVDWPRIKGNLSILLEAFGNSTDDELIFNAGTNIFIQRIRLYHQTEFGKVNVEIKSVKRQIEREFIRLILGKRLSVGWYWLYIEFNTRICQSEMEGTHCFPGPLLSSDNSKEFSSRQLVTGFSTKFEPNFARTFFPGWDEPSIRSTFNLSVKHFSDANILFNTSPLPENNNSLNNQLIKITNFETTPPMPLYLFAIATGPFNKPIEVKTTKTNLSLNVWSNNQDLLTANFVANFSPIMFDKLQEDFNVKYPLSKLDIFITPKYPVGGMENWGLIILNSNNVHSSNIDSTLPINEDIS